MPQAHDTIDIVVGVVFVLFYSGQRFNTPSTNRSSTTWGLFSIGLCAYCFSAVATYLVLVFVGKPLLGFLAGGRLPSELEAPLSNPLLMALFMTVLLPKLPLLSAIDQWVLKQMQQIAAIPFEALRLSAALAKSPFTVADGVRVAVSRRLQQDGLEGRDVRFAGEESPMREWASLTALLLQVEDWKSDRRMAGYCDAYRDVFQKIEDRHGALTLKARTAFKLLHEQEGTAETGKALEAIQRYIDDFSEQVSQVRDDLLAFISRGILYADLTDGARNRRLAALGFTVDLDRPRMTVNQMTSLFGLFLVLILSSSALAPLLRPGNSQPAGIFLARAIMVSLVYTVAVACAVFPKQYWKLAMREPGGPRPHGFYILAAAMAVVISQSIGFVFSCALERNVGVAAHRFLLTYPWAAQTFALTMVTAVLADDQPPVRWPRWLVSAIEGLCAAAVMVLVARFTLEWLGQRLHDHPDLVRSVKSVSDPRARFTQILAMAGAVGLMVGCLVPRWYRSVPRQPSDVPAPTPIPSVRAAPPAGTPILPV
jgi:hypothetical protein